MSLPNNIILTCLFSSFIILTGCDSDSTQDSTQVIKQDTKQKSDIDCEQFNKKSKENRKLRQQASLHLSSITNCIELYKYTNDAFPTQEVASSKCMNTFNKDPWGNDYHYEAPGKHNPKTFDLYSAGPDGKLGTYDDVSNWPIKKPEICITPEEKLNSVTIDIKTLKDQLALYQLAHDALPTTEQGLDALINKPTVEPVPSNWRKQMPNLPKDPWGNDYHYEAPGKHNQNTFDVYSAGPDGKPETDDDIGNW